MTHIVIGDQNTPYPIKINLLQIATYIRYFQTRSIRELKVVFERMELDKKTRESLDNIYNQISTNKESFNLRNVNKALSFELLSSAYMCFIDSPEQVKSHCLTKESNLNNPISIYPNYFAPSGKCDVEIDYLGFKIVLEVSSKTSMTAEKYAGQVKSAKDHAEKVRDNGYENTIYCLLINERSVKDNEIKDCLVNAQKKSNGQDIYFTSMTMDEFSELGISLEHDFTNNAKEISSASLRKCLHDSAMSLYSDKYLHLDQLILKVASDIEKEMNRNGGLEF